MTDVSKPRVAVFIAGIALLVLLGSWGIATFLSVDHDTPHNGIIVDKFIAVGSGTTEYHLLVNESGSIKDIQVDSVSYYMETPLGSAYHWTTTPFKEHSSELVTSFFAIGIALIGGPFWVGIVSVILKEGEAFHGPS